MVILQWFIMVLSYRFVWWQLFARIHKVLSETFSFSPVLAKCLSKLQKVTFQKPLTVTEEKLWIWKGSCLYMNPYSRFLKKCPSDFVEQYICKSDSSAALKFKLKIKFFIPSIRLHCHCMNLYPFFLNYILWLDQKAFVISWYVPSKSFVPINWIEQRLRYFQSYIGVV